VGKGGEESVRIRGEVDARCIWLQVQDRSNEGRILVGKAVVLLASPGASLNVIDTADVFPPDNFL